jgi:alkanesulfonate monooxygenase SsuD/methylene tetrahydromethanopterin reductase-like flavin-dependent oxidoreductase (luciferase family)
MQFGLFYQVPEAAGQTHAERFAEMLDLIVFGETLGFDVAWLAEIHFGGAFSLLSAPLMRVPIIAQRTQHIRIGTAVTLLPLHHPLSCAEQAATADVLSGGRLEFGVGRGSIPTQFYGFRIPVAENRARFGEALDIIRLAWTSERFSYWAVLPVDNLAVVPNHNSHILLYAWRRTLRRALRMLALGAISSYHHPTPHRRTWPHRTIYRLMVTPGAGSGRMFPSTSLYPPPPPAMPCGQA